LIDQLTIARQSVQALAANDWTGFTTAQTNISNSGALDPAGALTIQTDAESQNSTIQDRIRRELQAINQNLQICT